MKKTNHELVVKTKVLSDSTISLEIKDFTTLESFAYVIRFRSMSRPTQEDLKPASEVKSDAKVANLAPNGVQAEEDSEDDEDSDEVQRT